MNQWIKTKKQMPEAGLRVPFLYKTASGGLHLAFGHFNGLYWMDETDFIIDKDSWKMYPKKNVIYWLKLPETPKR